MGDEIAASLTPIKGLLFISHSSRDADTAMKIAIALESAGIPCWIAPRDVPAGTDYIVAIMAAINECRGMLLVYSRHAVESEPVKREVERAVNRRVPIIPVRLEKAPASPALEYLISLFQWIDAFPPPVDRHLDAIVTAVTSGLGIAYEAPKKGADAGPRYIGPYRILEVLGQGGMGCVYKAEQRSPIKRIVAIKCVKPGLDTKEVLARFEAERQALAMMNHRHVAKVLDASTDDLGRPFFVMEYVPGIPITQFADDNKLSIKQRLELFNQVCQAIAHAHSKAIIHRDIKARNVLAYMEGDKPIVKVIDFGIAKALGGDKLTDLTLNTFIGQVLGTYDSMSPEQADGSADIDTTTDVYSLGVLLYELLTGAQPFDSRTLAKAGDQEMRRVIREVEPPRPSTRVSGLGESGTKIAAARQAQLDTLAKELRSELEWIPLMAMRKERSRRYASVLDLAEDVENYLADRPLKAGPESTLYRLRKLVRRNLTAILATSAVLLLAVAGTVSYVVAIREAKQVAETEQRKAAAAWHRSEEQRLRADEAARQAIAEKQIADHRLYVADMLLCQSAWNDGQVDLLRARLEAHRPDLSVPGTSDPRGFEWYYWQRLIRPPPSLQTFSVESMALSPDGRFLVTGGNDCVARLWELTLTNHVSAASAAGKQVAAFENLPHFVWGTVFMPDGKQFITSCIDGSVRLWDAVTRKEIRMMRTGCRNCLAISPDGKRIVTDKGNDIKLWDLDSGKELLTLKGHVDGVRKIIFNPDGKSLASFADKSVRIWDAVTGQQLRQFDHEKGFGGVAFSPEGDRIVMAGGDKILRIWDVQATNNTEPLLILSGPEGSSGPIIFSPDGQRLASGGPGNSVQVWSLGEADESGSLSTPMIFRGHEGPLSSLLFDPSGRYVISGSYEGTVRFWDISREQDALRIHGHTGIVHGVAISPDGKTLASGSSDGSIKLWDSISGQERAILQSNGNWVIDVKFSPDGWHLASGGKDRRLKVWDVQTGQELMSLSGHTNAIKGVAFSPDGKLLASGSTDRTVKLWSAITGELVATLVGHESGIQCVVFSPDGQLLASACSDMTVKLWEVATGKELKTLRGHTGGLWSVAFSPDGKRLASGGREKNVKLWDVASGQEILNINVYGGVVYSLAFSPDGRRLATGGLGDVKLWDTSTGEELLVLRSHRGAIAKVFFSRDGNRLISSGGGGMITISDAMPPEKAVQNPPTRTAEGGVGNL